MPRCEMQPLAKRGVEQYDLGKGSDTWIAVAVPGIGTLDCRCYHNFVPLDFVHTYIEQREGRLG